MKTLSHSESLELIRDMMQKAQKDMYDSSSWYLLWGWLVCLASLSHYILLQTGYDKPWLAWLLMPLGALLSLLKGRRDNRLKSTRSAVSDVLMALLFSFLVCLIITLAFMPKLGESTYPMVLLLYGIWLFVSGSALQFRPLKVGGVVNWGMAIAAFMVDRENQLLVLALAVLLGYILPGHLLRRHFQRMNMTKA